MNSFTRSRLAVAAVTLLCLVITARQAPAQTLTTGTLSGTVADPQGAVLPGTTVAAVHEPTGTSYEAVTNADGRFEIPNVRVGGPYRVSVSLSGFKEYTASNINVSLGEDRAVNVTLQLQNVTESVTVVATTQIITRRAPAPPPMCRGKRSESLPTIQRGIFDFARTSPYFNATADSAGNDTMMSVAGRNNRYNSIQIDGAVNNDVFGIPSSGVPGGQTGSQPISLDAIQEVQLVVAPYDVRQGGFSGGSMNAVTKSGSNAFSGYRLLVRP